MNNKLAFVISSLAVAAMVALSLWVWPQLPATQQIPVHFGIDGTPDRYGGKFEGLLLTPLIAAGITLLLAVLPNIDPRAQNLLRSETAYAATWYGTIALLGAIHGATVLQVLGWQINVATVVSVGVGGLLAIIGNYLGKVRSNFSFGIRTPWTLSSDRAWSKTHRLGGRLLLLLGVGCVLAALFNANGLFLALALGGTGGIILWAMMYSYWVWKHDPERQRRDL
ncbi:MAG: SdpI family protein [Nodosilinea sp.]